ncbi:MAG: hypothetical protein S4CHLAM2_18210 [Chlamydiales bacterium]|nr:hypothetical protein [Chlamydiales bacterium]
MMMDRIRMFEKNEISIGKLIADLRALLDCLNDMNQDWINRFYSEWFTIEQVHAAALDRGGIEKVEKGKKLIDISVKNLKSLISEI